MEGDGDLPFIIPIFPDTLVLRNGDLEQARTSPLLDNPVRGFEIRGSGYSA